MAVRIKIRHGDTPPSSSALEQYELGYYSGNNGLYIKNKSNNVVQINDVNTSKGLEYINAKGNAYSLNTKAAVRITNAVPDSSGDLMLAAVRSNDGYFGLRASDTGTFTLYFVQTKDLGQPTGEMKNIAQGYQNGLFEVINDLKVDGEIVTRHGFRPFAKIAIITNENLNNLCLEDGIYIQGLNNDTSFELNYPVEKAGMLSTVISGHYPTSVANAQTTYQLYHTYDNTARYVRTYYTADNVWYPWKRMMYSSAFTFNGMDVQQDETNLNNFLQALYDKMQPQEMVSIAFSCYPAIGSGQMYHGFLSKHTDLYGELFAFTYGRSILFKHRNSNGWQPTVIKTL